MRQTEAMQLNLSADDLLSTTRTVRKRLDFDRPVEREVIEECLSLAVQAPTGSNRQEWQWIFVTDHDTKMALTDLYRENFAVYRKFAETVTYEDGDVRGDRQPMVFDSAAYLAENFHRAPVLMVPCIAGKLDGAPAAMAAAAWGSLLPAVWSFMLAARERGIGTAWTTIHMLNGGDKKAAEILGIPDTHSHAGLFPIAYTKGTDFKTGERLPLETITHWERW